jgi:hypothetical protein
LYAGADGQWLVPGIIQEVKADRVKVLVKGSFFQTNGVAVIHRDLALAA